MKSKVLLIDDSVTIHRVIDLSIDVDRYEIVKVFAKEDAALKMQTEQYDYILLDNKLDNIIITEYIKELKAAQPSASIILLVGAFDRFDESDLEKTGADDYLVKPFDSQSLNEKLSSDADMMPAGIVEKIAEADFARDNDDYITPTASLTTGEVIDGLSKKEYLENLEEVQPEDLTDNGYAEDLDTAPSLELNKLPKEAEEALQQSQEENIQTEENTDNTEDIPVIEENNTDEEIPAQAEEVLVNETLPDETAVEETVSDTTVITEENHEEAPSISEVQEEENTLDNMEEVEIPDNITAVRNPILPDIDNAADISDEYIMQDNLAEVDNISKNERVDEFPDFPDVDDISTDEMQDIENIEKDEAEEIENIELPHIEETDEELPVDNLMEESADKEVDIPAEEIEKETLNNEELEETPAETEEEKDILLVDDDDWLSDAPAAQEETYTGIQSEELQPDLEENIENNNLLEENNIEEEAAEEISTEKHNQEEVQEEIVLETLEENETIDEPVLHEENNVEATVESLDIPAEEDNGQEDITAEKEDELPDMPSLEEIPAVEENIEMAEVDIVEEKEPMEEKAKSLTEELVEEGNEEILEENAAEEPLSVKTEDKAETQETPETLTEEAVLPAQKEHIPQEASSLHQTEVKQAERYSPETSNRFGGITVTISRDEIIAMLGNAIDKHFLEEAVKEVIASNMKEIVRNIVPAIAEKYIKEEIERLKNDE